MTEVEEVVITSDSPADSTSRKMEQQQQAMTSLMNYLENDCPEMALFGVFIDRFECDDSSNNVRIWFKNGNYYEGAFSGGTMDGVGKYLWSDGLAYDGSFQKNALEGFGNYSWPDANTYEGDVKDGLCDGNGLMRLANGQMYNGQWQEGEKKGLGTMTYDAEGLEAYSGEWAKERRHGFGYYQYGKTTPAQYAGYWMNGCRHGAGSAMWPEQQQVYSGYWDRGVQQGIGRHVWAADRVTPAQYQLQNSYVGECSAGQRHGKGTFYYAGGASYSGSWVENVKHGPGKVTFKNGESYEGEFSEDRLVGGPGYIDIARTPDPRLFERQLTRKVDNDETLSALLASCIPGVLESPQLRVERSDGTSFGPADHHAEPDQSAVDNCCTVLLRFASELRRVFSFYCDLAFAEIPDAVAYTPRCLTRLLWWRLIKDSRMPFCNERIRSVADLDRLLAKVLPRPMGSDQDSVDIHDVYQPILFGDLLVWLLATALLEQGYGRPGYLHNNETVPPASVCLERFLTDYVLPNCCIVHGRVFTSHDNAATTMRSLAGLVALYHTLADVETGPGDRTVSGRQLVGVVAAAGIAAATPAVKALAGNVFLSAEADCTPYVFAELTALEVGEALAEIAEFVNEGLASGSTEGVLGSAVEPSPARLGSVVQDSQGGEGIFMIRSATGPTFRGTPGRIDWPNIVQHLLALPNLIDLPRLALSLRQTTLQTPAPRAVSGLSSSRSPSPQGRQTTEVPTAEGS